MNTAPNLTRYMVGVFFGAIALVLLLTWVITNVPALTWIATVALVAVILISIPLLWHFHYLDQEALAHPGTCFPDRIFVLAHAEVKNMFVQVEECRITYFTPQGDAHLFSGIGMLKASASRGECRTPSDVRFLRRMRGGLTNEPTGYYFLECASAAKDEPEYWEVFAAETLIPEG